MIRRGSIKGLAGHLPTRSHASSDAITTVDICQGSRRNYNLYLSCQKHTDNVSCSYGVSDGAEMQAKYNV